MRSAAVLLMFMLGACGTSPSPSSPEPLAGPSEQVSIFTHCGFYEADFDGVLWTPDSIERGDYPEGTGFNATTGVMTRHGDRALFQADTGLEVWFKLAPAELSPPPPCD